MAGIITISLSYHLIEIINKSICFILFILFIVTNRNRFENKVFKERILFWLIN